MASPSTVVGLPPPFNNANNIISHAAADVAGDAGGLNGTNLVCYAPTMISTNGIWMDAQPLNYSLPLFILQLIIVVITTRTLVVLLRPFHQPRVVAEVFGGIILGPSVMGRIPGFGDTLFPSRSTETLETMAHLGLLYFLFLVGVEMDVHMITRIGRKSFVIAAVGISVPFFIGFCCSFAFHGYISVNVHLITFAIFLGVALSVTAFPVLARILAEAKLLNTELGKVAMSVAIVNDIFAWLLLAVAIALAKTSEGTVLSFFWVLVSGAFFVVLCFFVVRPIMWWVVRRMPEGEPIGDFYVSCILTGVVVAGFITDAVGIHPVFGAFVFGLVIPGGPLGEVLIEKLEDFVTTLLLPLFFVISGLRMDLSEVKDPAPAALLALIFLLASICKVVATTLVSLYYSMPFHEGLSLGFLMDTRGLVEIILLNIGRDREVLDQQSFAVMLLMSVVATSTVTPVVKLMNKPSRRLVAYKRRNLQLAKLDSEVRMVACIHGSRNVPTIISFLEASNPTKRSPIFFYALHLLELTGRASAMLIVHNSKMLHTAAGRSSSAESENIMAALETYEQHAGGVSVQPLTAISPYSTMHEDICSLAEDKHACLIVLPFHKNQTVDGDMETTNPAVQTVNQNVLATSPCSVAILVDRGLGATDPSMMRRVAVLFFGGPDDREALAYAQRMATHPGINLTLVRFLPSDGTDSLATPTADARVINIVDDRDRERQEDDEYVKEFRLKHVDDHSVFYEEKIVENSEGTVEGIRSLGHAHNLYVVGRSHGVSAIEMVSGLTEWSECPELGPIGDLLASTDFGSTASVLVMQQFVLAEAAAAEPIRQPAMQQQYLNNANNRRRVVVGTHRGIAAPTGSRFNVGWDERNS